MKATPEPHAELLSSEDVHHDVASLTAALDRRRAERRAHDILERPGVQDMLDQIITSGRCANEEEAIEEALKAFMATGAR